MVEMSGNLLLIDDEESIREILSYNLEKTGFIVDAAKDGLEGLELLSQKEYDYVLLDLKMPRMSGEVLLQKAKKLYPNYKTKYVIITAGIANNYSDENKQIIKNLADAYITKPFNREKIIEVLKSV